MEPQITFEKATRGIDNKQKWLDTHSAGKELTRPANSTNHEIKDISFELFARSGDGQEIYFTGKTPDSERFEEATVMEVKIGKDKFKLYPPLKISFSNDGFLDSESADTLKNLVTEKPMARQNLAELFAGSKTRLIPESKELTLMEIAQNSLGFDPGSLPMILNSRIKQQR